MPDDVGPLTLDRLRIAASAYRAYRRPVLVTGGSQPNAVASLGRFMAEVLECDMGSKQLGSKKEPRTRFRTQPIPPPSWTQTTFDARFSSVRPGIFPARFGHSHTLVFAPHRSRAANLYRSADQTARFPSGLSMFRKEFLRLHELFGLAYYRFIMRAYRLPSRRKRQRLGNMQKCVLGLAQWVSNIAAPTIRVQPHDEYPVNAIAD